MFKFTLKIKKYFKNKLFTNSGFFPFVSYTPHKVAGKYGLRMPIFLQLVGKLVCLVWLSLFIAVAQANDDSVYEFDIPAQALIKSLNVLSNQTETLVLFPYDLVENRKGNAVKGQFTVRQALDEMLRDIGLVGGLSKKGVLMISLAESETVNSRGEDKMKTKKSLLASAVAFLMASGGNSSLVVAAEDVQKDGNSGLALEEVIVTAQRREQSLQDTPITVQSFGAEELSARAVVNIESVAQYVPNINIGPAARGGIGSSIYIRGIGQTFNRSSRDPGVGMYIDDVYNASSIGGLVDLLDVEQIEILKGPQGTLYGKNTIGGAVKITTRKPSENLEGSLSMTVGDFDRFDVKTFLNVPLSDQLFAKVSLLSRKRDGHVESVVDGTDFGDDNTKAASVQFRWLPSEDVTVDFSVDGTTMDNNGGAQKLFAVNPTGTQANQINQLIAAGLVTGPTIDNSLIVNDDYDNSATGVEGFDYEGWGVGLNIAWEVNGMTVKSITSFRKFDAEALQDFDTTPLTLLDTSSERDNEAFTQEFNISGLAFDDRLDWLVGVYYFDQTAFQNSMNVFAPDLLLLDQLVPPQRTADFSAIGGFTQDTESLAVFTHMNYRLTDQWSLTFGLRYTDEEKSLDTRRVNGLFTSMFVQDPSISDSWTNTQPKIGLQFDMSEDAMIYASVAKGFKSGGFNDRPRSAAEDPIYEGLRPYDPEEVLSYELGIKSEWFNNRLRLNAALFFIDYEDVQIGEVVVNTGNGRFREVLQNAGEAESKGFEMDFVYLLNENFTLNGSLGILDAEFQEGPDSGLVVEGTPLAQAPDLSYTLGLAYSKQVGVGELSARIDYSWRDDHRLNNDERNIVLEQDAYDLINASLSYAHENWVFSVFGTNLGDEFYAKSGSESLYSCCGTANIDPARPREFGVSVKYSFE